MKYRVMISSTMVGIPDWELGTYARRWHARLVTVVFNIIHGGHLEVARYEEVK